MSGDIVLSAALRSNLLSLQGTQRNIDTTQLRLATGLKVNSALDNPTNFFTAQSLTNRASDLSRLLDGISQSIRTIEEADNGVTALTGLLEQAESISLEAQSEVRSAEGFARIRGNVDLSGITDLTSLSAITAADAFDVTVIDEDGRTATQTVAIGAGDNIDDVISAINTSTQVTAAPATGPAGTQRDFTDLVRARLTDNGQFAIESLREGVTIRVEGQNAGFTTSNDAFAALGLDTITAAEGATFGGTSVAGNVLSSAVYAAAATGTDGSFEASETLANAGFVTAGATSIQLTIDGTVTTIDNGGANFATTATVQDVIDGINTAGVGVTASLDTVNGRLQLTFDESIGQVDITFGNGGTNGFNFGGSGQTNGADLSELFTFDGVNADVDQFEEDFNEIRTQIDNLVEDANYRGVNLLGGDDLTTFFNEDRDNTLTTTGADFTVLGLGIDEATFTDANSVQQALDDVRAAISEVRSFGLSIANDLNIIQTRRDFTEQTIATLKSGADDLTVADQNEEGANLLALQTRQQLGVTSLSLAAQSQQSVLRLF